MTSSTAGVTTLEQRMTSMEVSFATLSATLGTKLDSVAAAIEALSAAMASQHNDHEARMRLLEGRKTPDADITDHEARLRVLEGRPYDAAIPSRVTALEKFKWTLVGAAMASGGILGGIAGAIASALVGG